MYTDRLKVMLELQALQNFNPSQKSSSQNFLFKEVFNEMLIEQKLLGTTNQSQENKQQVNLLQQTMYTKPITNYVPTNVQTKLSSANNFEQIIEKAAEKYQLPAKLIHSIIKHESNFNPNAVSRAGAAGLMQLMPRTAQSLGVKNAFDPMDNIFGGSKYIRQMLDRYNGDIRLALAAYNAGPGNVDKYNGVPPFKETQNYVSKVMNTYFA